MRDHHIKALLENRPVARLSGEEIARIEAHVAHCLACRRAYETARVAETLVRARASETADVPPFFKTKVMAAIREQKSAPDLPTLVRLWKAASAMVSAMAVMVMVLVGVTVFGNGGETPPAPTLAAAEMQSLYSPEYVVLEADDFVSDALADDQVLDTVYDWEEADGN